MKKLFKKITGFTPFFFFISFSSVLADDITTGDSVISRPVGVGILPGSGIEGADIQSSALFSQIIPFLLTWAINLAIGLSVIVLIFGGYQFLTAFGNTEKYDQAIRTIIYAAIGLVISLTAYGIITIITRLQFS